MIEFFNTKLCNLMSGWPLSDFTGSDMQGRTCPAFRHMSERGCSLQHDEGTGWIRG